VKTIRKILLKCHAKGCCCEAEWKILVWNNAKRCEKILKPKDMKLCENRVEWIWFCFEKRNDEKNWRCEAGAPWLQRLSHRLREECSIFFLTQIVFVFLRSQSRFLFFFYFLPLLFTSTTMEPVYGRDQCRIDEVCTTITVDQEPCLHMCRN
jgi:hypothetical protein